jgi:hypothetical protein
MTPGGLSDPRVERTTPDTDHTTGSSRPHTTETPRRVDRSERDVSRSTDLNHDRDRGVNQGTVAARQEDRFGGVKVGSALFGWLTAAGIATLLTGLLTATGAAIGLANTADAGQAAAEAAPNAQAGTVAETAKNIGIIGAVALLVILFLAYYCGGYVAGRMARFNGTRQGLAVWVWGLVLAALIAVVTAVAGAKYDVLARLNLPRLPINEGTLTTGGIITIVAIALVTLAGALLGGKAGMRFHRKVDDSGYEGYDRHEPRGATSR